jgi:hypothetical protein
MLQIAKQKFLSISFVVEWLCAKPSNTRTQKKKYVDAVVATRSRGLAI